MLGGDELAKITDLAKDSPYSAEYLSLRARQGKLKAKKVDNVWYTTLTHLNEYRATQAAKKDPSGLVSRLLVTGKDQSARTTKLETSDRDIRQPWFLKWVAIPFSLLILLGFIPIQALHQSLVLSMGIVNDLADESSKSLKEEIRQTVGKPPKTPALIHNFYIYSRTLLAKTADSAGWRLSKFYEEHPFLLAASITNFGQLKERLIEKYGPTSPSAIELAIGSVNKLTGNQAGKGQIAGVKNVRVRTVAIAGDVGTVTLSKGEIGINLVSQNKIRSLSISPTRTLADYQPRLVRIDDQTIQLKLTKPAANSLEFIWRKL